MKTWNERFGFLICAGLALLVTPAAAQNPTGTIFGIVSDTSGGALAGVEITIHNVDTGLERRSMTNEMGEYRVPLLPAGTYEATAVFPGFKTAVRSDLHLNIQATLRTDLVLQLGEVKETVKVTGQAPLLETETSASGHVIDNKQIENLPLNVRQFMQLAYLVPFSTPASRDYRSTETPRGTPVPAGAGARPEENNYQIDGIDNKESGRNNFSVTPPMDSIGEFRVQTGMAPAEFGRGGGTVINLVTRSGSNDLHGSAYEYLRNNDLDSRPYFASGVSPLKRNQFGASLGGPIARNKLLFFGNYEGYRQSATGNPPVGQVPDANLRAGVFPSPIVDPITKVPFPNNTIPASLIDPTSTKILNLWPLPNNPGVAARNFIFNSVPSAHDNRDWVVGRVDYNINERNTLYGRYLFDNEITHNPPTLPNNIGANERDLRAQAAGGHYLKTITPHIVNDLSYGYMRYHNVIQTAFSYKENLISQFGITNTLSDNNPLFWGTPGVSIPGYLGTDSGNPNYRTSTIHEAQDGLGWNHGRHFLKFGGDVRIVDTTMLYTGGNGSWSFANSYSGNNFADFLLGYPSQISKTSRRPVGYNRVKYLGLYAQDDFKLSRNVTLNLGMRYEIETIPDDPTHSMVGFDPTDGSLLVSSRIASAQAVKDFYANVRPDIKYRFIDANAPVNTDTNNVAARLGLAWQIAKGTTVRGGYGMFYGSPQTSSYLASGSNDFAPNTLRPIWTSNPGTPSFKGYNPDGTLSPEAALQSAALTLFPFLAGRVSGNSVVYDTGRSFPYPLVQQFLFSVQHQVSSNFLVEVQYFGSRTQHLIGNDNMQVTTPGPGAVAARLPYPGLARIENTAAWHRAWYNGVAVKAQQRLSHGLSYLVSYTLSKSLDDASTLNDDPEWTDSRNKLNGRGPSDFDVRNRLVGSFQYELPVGRGRHFGGAWPRLADALLGGWGVRGIASFQTGFEYSPTMAVSRVGACLAACVARPERVGNGNLDKSVRNINGFWDINAFAFPPAFTLGSPSGRNVLYGPGVNNWDLDIYKQFRIGERQSLEFRYEAFNAFNHAQFNAPPANLEAPATFGKITGTAAPRISQLVLRYQF